MGGAKPLPQKPPFTPHPQKRVAHSIAWLKSAVIRCGSSKAGTLLPGVVQRPVLGGPLDHVRVEGLCGLDGLLRAVWPSSSRHRGALRTTASALRKGAGPGALRTVPALTRVPRARQALTLSGTGYCLPAGALATSITWQASLYVTGVTGWGMVTPRKHGAGPGADSVSLPGPVSVVRQGCL